MNAKARTAELVWTTGTRVLRGHWDKFYEELSLDPKHVRMGRLESGTAPLLDAHDGESTDGVIGVIESARLEDGRGVCVVRFPAEGIDERIDKMFSLIVDGILCNVSVGYRVYKMEHVEDGDDTIPVMRAIDWEPYEVSIVPIGADSGGRVRSESAATNPCVLIGAHRGVDEMPKKTTETEVQTRAAELERERCSGILRTARLMDLGDDLAENLIRDGVSLDDARAQIIDRRAEADPVGGIRSRDASTDRYDATHGRHTGGGPSFASGGRVIGGAGGGGDDFRAAAVDSILLRAGVRVAEPHPGARDVSARVDDLARVCLSRAGMTVRDSGRKVLLRSAQSTSDFPYILADAMHKAVRIGYEDEPSSHRDWVRSVSVQDFRDQHRPILGSAPALDEVNELGEYQNGNMADDSTSYTVAKYGKIVALSWEALVNDDLSTFMRVKPAMGQAARRKEADLVYDMFAENAGAGPTMQDAQVLFHADHNNLTTGAVLSAAQLGAGRALLRKQTALGGGYMALVPRFLIVPAEQETQAELLLASATRQISADLEALTPQWLGKLILVVEPRLADTTAYLAAATSQIDTVELGLLEDNMGGPSISEEEGFRTDRREFKVRHVCGAKVMDWRGLVKMPLS